MNTAELDNQTSSASASGVDDLALRKRMGIKLRSFRDEQKMTLQALSAATGLSISSLSRNETGDRDILLSEVLSICGVMGSKEQGFSRYVEFVMLVGKRIM